MTQSVNTLKSLTQTTYDSLEGYRSAAEKAESPALKQALERRVSERSRTLTKLNDALKTQGEEPISSTSTAASMHQGFLNIADTFSDGDEAAAKRVEEGEDYLVEQFRDAFEDDDIQFDSSVEMVVQSAYREIREGEKFGDMIERQYA